MVSYCATECGKCAQNRCAQKFGAGPDAEKNSSSYFDGAVILHVTNLRTVNPNGEWITIISSESDHLSANSLVTFNNGINPYHIHLGLDSRA